MEFSSFPQFGNMTLLIFNTSAGCGSMDSGNSESEIFGGKMMLVSIMYIVFYPHLILFLKQYSTTVIICLG